ncbi:MAG: NAD-dependent epimerase/dehydratase family protein, partial [Pseudomonadales bacterium]
MNRVLVTGGAGFIGSAVIRFLISNTSASVLICIFFNHPL